MNKTNLLRGLIVETWVRNGVYLLLVDVKVGSIAIYIK